MLDGLYILNESGSSLLTFSINGVVPSLAPFAALVPPVLSRNDWARLIEISASQLVYVKKYGHLFIFVPCSSSSPPLMIEQLVNRVVEIIEAYFHNTLTAALISDHKAEIVWILSESLDSDIPLITQPDIMRQIVYKEDFLSKLMGTATLSSAQSAISAASKGQSSLGSTNNVHNQHIPDALVPWELPWRRSRIKHASEELFVDIIERARIVTRTKTRGTTYFNSSARSVSSTRHSAETQITGEIRLLSRLSNTPQVTIDLASELSLDRAQFHQCIDMSILESSHGKQLVFTPPDLESLIVRYKTSVRDAAPVGLSLVRSNEAGGDGSFEVRLSTDIHRKVEHVSGLVARIAFPPSVKVVKELSVTTGDLDASNPRLCEYRLAKTVPMGWNALLRALATDAEGTPVAPLYAEISYSLVGRTPSPMAVRSMHITPRSFRQQDSAPYKGVRYQTIMESHLAS